MSDLVDISDKYINLYDNPIFKELLKKSNMMLKDLNLTNKDLEVNLTKLDIDIPDIDEELIQKIIFEKRLKKFFEENNLHPTDTVKKTIIEENYHRFKDLNKFQDLVDYSHIYSREEFIFHHITEWKQYDEYHNINPDMDFACKTLAENIDFLNTLIETNYYGEQNGGWSYIINRDIYSILY